MSILSPKPAPKRKIADRNRHLAADAALKAETKKLRDRVVAKLAESGIDWKLATKVGIRIYTAAECESKLKALPAHAGGFTIPYHDLSKRPTGFYRFRYMEDVLDRKKKPIKYAQVKGSRVKVYFPPNYDWAKLPPGTPVVIVEGELKALCACALGIPCIAIGGVNSFADKKRGIELLPPIKNIGLKDRPMILAYDSDAEVNANVEGAESALGFLLAEHGSIVRAVRLPSLFEDRKTGLDDYLMAKGADAFIALCKETDESEASCALRAMNAEFCRVAKPSCVIEIATHNIFKMTEFVYEHAAPRKMLVAQGTTSVSVSVADTWRQWEGRNEVGGLTYKPGQPSSTKTGEFNLWRPGPFVPVPGDASLYLELVDFLLKDADTKMRKWFMQWLAYPFQHPGAKLHTAVLLWGLHGGTGKSMLGHLMIRLYGKPNAANIDKSDLTGRFNLWAAQKQFIMGTEITGDGGVRDSADKIKAIITEPEIFIEKKGIDKFPLPNVFNLYMTSNHPDALLIGDHERRYAVVEVKGAPKIGGLYRSLGKVLRSESADDKISPAILHHLMNEVDCKDFDPYGPAPRTQALAAMVDAGRSNAASWCKELRELPENILEGRNGTLFTTEELLTVYAKGERCELTAKGIARELHIAGFELVNNGNPVRLPDSDKRPRLWAVRDRLKIQSLTVPEIGARYAAELEAGRRKFERVK